MIKRVRFFITVVCFFAFVEGAHAAPPTLNSAGQQKRHPTAGFSAPRASDVTIYVADKPDRGTDGSFLSENVKEIDFMVSSEIQAGQWLYERQIDPGTYYVMLHATPDFSSCYDFDTGTLDPACASGYSAVVPLTIRKPSSRYGVTAQRYSYINLFSLTLRAAPLGEARRYSLCYRLKSRRRVCLRGTLNGYDWNSPVSDTLTIGTRNLARRTTFTWYVRNSAVARKTLLR